MKRRIYTVILSVVLACALTLIAQRTDITRPVCYKIYDELTKAEYQFARRTVPDEILFVTIDNKTLSNMPECWPYSRAKFARVIDNLKAAGAKVIAFDFIFYGSSTAEDDAVLKKSIEDAGNVVLGAALDEEGRIHMSAISGESIPSGITTKFQDPDGVTRKSLTYLVSRDNRRKGFVSWGMGVVKFAKGADFLTLTDSKSIIKFRSDRGEEWRIPVDRETKSFLIHFKAHTSDFKRISFYDVLNGDFDRDAVKDKIALVGLASTMFGDIHNTPLGWMPGITLNANAFLALYNHDFLTMVPKFIDVLIVILGVIIASITISIFNTKKTIVFIGAEIILFMAVSFILLIAGRVWDYSLFPLAVILCPYLSKKLLDLTTFM